MTQQSATFLDRTLGNLLQTLRGVTGGGSGQISGTLKPDLPDSDLARLRAQFDACLERRGGEVSSRLRAVDLARAYVGLDSTGRERFLRLLAQEYDTDEDEVQAAISALTFAGSAANRRRAEVRLREMLVPSRVRLLTGFNGLDQGVKFLVDLRADLLPLCRDDEEMKALDNDLKGLFASWFDIGFLELKRITWDSPASLLEKLIDYEAVHEIRSWTDLKNRLDSDRRCYAFLHPGLPGEPLIFVEVALVNGMADNVQRLLDPEAPALDPEQADTAVFYSISNCQKGLAGVTFGNFLIKQVVDALTHDLPGLRTFATLSPLPDFRHWLDERFEEGENGAGGMISRQEAEELRALAGTDDVIEAVRSLLDRTDWHLDDQAAGALRAPLMRHCARYLLGAKRGDRARDRVAHFHLSNGARVERINWLGDTSSKGLRQSAGMMVNYRYKLDQIEANHEAYTGDGRVVSHTSVKKQAKG